MCGSNNFRRNARTRAGDSVPGAPAVPSDLAPEARVGDAERDAALDDLLAAAGEGYLRPEELDERTTRALDARTAGELAALLDDLPPRWLRRRDTERRTARKAAKAARAARASLRPHLTAYAVVMTALVAVWLVVGLTAGAWYPWPLWPALLWGFSVAGHVRAARAAAPGGPGVPQRPAALRA